jgi:hypothetical protein
LVIFHWSFSIRWNHCSTVANDERVRFAEDLKMKNEKWKMINEK